MYKFIISTICIFSSLSSHAETRADFALGARFRSYPRGGGANIEMGIGQTIWGSSSDAIYGFARLGAEAMGVDQHLTSGIFVELFPISLLGVRVGYNSIQNYLDYDHYDCSTYDCRGKWNESYFEVPLYLKFWRFLFAAGIRKSIWSSDQISSQPHYIEPSSSLPLLHTHTESVQELRATSLIEFNEVFRLGYYFGTWQAKNYSGSVINDRKSEIWLALAQTQLSKMFESQAEIVWTIGIGEFKPALHVIEPTIVTFIRYSPFKKMGY